MGHAYEQYTSVYLKRERGQYFTNRLAIDLLVGMVDPDYMSIVLDPAVQRSKLDAQLRINPQLFLPHLNETLEIIQSLDGQNGWTVAALSELSPDIRIFKGPRFKSESIIVEEMKEGVEPYYTPSAVLQEKSDSAKLIDVTRASQKQLATIDAIRVKRGDVVITRSGSIGRVAYITQKFDNAIVSDDLIRVRIPDKDVRMLVLGFLQSKYAQIKL